MRSFQILIVVTVFFISLNFAALLDAQKVTKREEISGQVVSTIPGKISIKTADGPVVSYKIQNKDEDAISIDGQPIRVPAEISVAGTIPIKLVQRGMVVQFFGSTNVYGKSKTEVKSMDVLLSDTEEKLQADFLERKENNHDECKCKVVGRVLNLTKNKLELQIEKAKWARNGRITFLVSEDCVLNIADDHLDRVRPKDIVESAKVLHFEGGDKVILAIDVALAADRENLTTTYDGKLEQEFSHLPDEPADIRELRSKHFVLYTDISDRQAAILLSKLETMHGLVSGYYLARPKVPIECYVVRDLRKWEGRQLDPRGAAKIAEPAGLTIYASNGRQVKAVVYSCDKHAVVQHEAVHAFCALTFGSAGPVWYAEGMAEIGAYWKPGEKAVNIDPVVIDFLTNSEKPKRMAAIVAAGQITGDSWQAYAWRWALCHLLANNPNYSRRFKKLGLNIMAKKEDSFDLAFGKVADKISFEYDQFVQNFGNGYRVDLCVWDWRTKASNLSSDGRVKQLVKANHGWHATKLQTRSGVSYDYVVQGKWRTSAATEEVSVDGHADGTGKLIGVIYNDFELSEPFELGEKGTFVGDQEGQLLVRCRDSWTSLSDNEGKVTLFIRRTPKSESE
jgi:hypothetical protein